MMGSRWIKQVSPLFLSLVVLGLASAAATTSDGKESEHNANHIFNAIHSSMRQWGSSLHHNGMSFFIATVPANTVFYHGTSQEKAVEGTEWLAFEPEHALFFAHPHGGPGGPGGGPPGGPGGGPPGGPGGRGPGGPGGPGRQPGPPPTIDNAPFDSSRQKVFESTTPKRETSDTGYLHTYMTKHKLRLLYLDGMSAAKSDKGTLDTQDFILANQKSEDGGGRGGGGGIGGEYGRARQMCRRAKKEWKGKIDGILRMESGFEIILCSFKDHLETVRITAVEKQKEDDGEGNPGRFNNDEDMMSFFQAITSRYHGIGGDRVTVDLDDFVTAFTYPQADLFAGGTQRMPRLNATKKQVIESISQAIDRLATRKEDSDHALYDWQAIVDMIVARHAPRLAYLTSNPSMTSRSAISAELDRSMRPYIDYSKRDAKKEIERCATDLIPSHWPSNTAGQAVMRVTHRICSTLSSLQQQSRKQDVTLTRKSLEELKEWLDWTVWKQCTGCLSNEVCLVPMWPHGGIDDWEHPSCVNASSLGEHRGYWGGGGPGGGPRMY